MEVLFKMAPIDWIVFWLSVGAHVPLTIGLLKERNDASQTFFTWLMYFILEVVTLFSCAKIDGNFVIIFGFATGSMVMSLVLFYQRRIKLTGWETFVFSLVIVCLIIWYHSGPYWALLSEIIAGAIIGIYLIVRTFKHKLTKYNSLGYATLLIASILSVISGKDWSVEEVGFPFVEMVLNFVILTPLIRKKVQA